MIAIKLILKQILSSIKNNYKSVVLGVVIAAFFTLEWVLSGAFSFGETDYLVSRYTDSEELYVVGYEINGDEYCRSNANAYIVIPVSDYVNKINLNIDNMGNDKLALKIYYSDGSGDNIYRYKQIKNINGNVSVTLPSDTCRIKLKFEQNLYETISIQEINLFDKATFFNLKLIITMVFTFVIAALIASIVLIKFMAISDENYVSKFIIFLIVGESCFLIINFVTNGYYWGTYFFPTALDSFMDHFNMLALLNSPDPYYQKASYPAMCFVLLKIVYYFLPLDIQAVESGVDLRDNMIAMFWFVVIIIVNLYFLALLFEKALGANSKKYSGLILLLTGPILFTIQRGNILLLAFTFLTIYYLYYDSDAKKKRYIAYFALAFSASIKIYPALFGLLTLKTKRYKETVHLAIIGFLTFSIPFFAFDGIDTFKEFLDGLNAAGTVMTTQGVGQNISLENLRLILNLVMGINIPSSGVFLALVTVVLMVVAYIASEEWEALFLIATACAWYPAFSFSYVILLYYPAVFSALKSAESIKKKDFVFLGVLLLPLGLPYMEWVDRYVDADNLQMPMSFSYVVLYFVIIAMVIQIMFRVIMRRIHSSNCEVKIRKIEYAIIASLVCLIVVIYGVNNNRSYSDKYDFVGKGTEDSPYEISSVDDFLYLVKMSNAGESFSGAYFIQTADLTFDGFTSVDPIGWTVKNAKFSGTYDGQGYSIINYYSMSDNDEEMGIFGELDGSVYNLNVYNCNINGESVGGLAYKISTNGSICNCYVQGMVYGYTAGSIAAINYGTIENCLAVVNNSATYPTSIADCDSTGKIINSYDSNSNYRYKINTNTFQEINGYVDRSNGSIFSKVKLCYWILDDTYLVSVSNEY